MNDAWWQTGVVYQIYPRSFKDTSANGVGDLQGIIDELDYLADFGIDAIWISPFYPSPMKDFGYDVADYCDVDPLFGDLETFDRLLDGAHQRGLKIIIDWVPNHTSDEHPWFLESKKNEDNPFRDYYIWSKSKELYKDARIIFEGLCTSNWEKYGDWYYFHRFFEFQPDLNYRNPEVLLEMSRNFVFWLTQGVDGFRADAIPYLWKEDGTTCENHPMTHTVVKFFRSLPVFRIRVTAFRNTSGRITADPALIKTPPLLSSAMSEEKIRKSRWVPSPMFAPDADGCM